MAIDIAIIAGIALAVAVAAAVLQLLLPRRLPLASAIPAAITSVLVLLPFAYFFTTVAVTGQTIGKGLMGLRVVTTDGKRLGILRTLVRTLAYLVSIIPLFAGFFWILVDGDRRGWHDHIAGSRVVFDHPRAADR